jgi:hypothetical protein
MPVWAVSWVPPPTMPRLPQTMGRWANSPCGPGVYAKDWVVMRLFLHPITMHEIYAGDILVYNTTFRGGERSATNAMQEEEQLWRVCRMSSGSN